METRKGKSGHLDKISADVLSTTTSITLADTADNHANADGHADKENPYPTNGLFMGFTKGLLHDPKTGIVSSEQQLNSYREAIQSRNLAEFDKIRIGSINRNGKNTWYFHNHLRTIPDRKQVRRWESPAAKLVLDTQTPDATNGLSSETAAALPAVEPKDLQVSEELTAEMAEVYLFALLRDVPLACLDSVDGCTGESEVKVDQAINILRQLPFYKKGGDAEHKHWRPKADALTKNTAFRGQAPGEQIGPYLSQFMLVGNRLMAGAQNDVGSLPYGAINIDLRVQIAETNKDYMTHWNEWLDVQHGANVKDTQTYTKQGEGRGYRYISTPRDMATYVRFDALYDSYLNTCLWLLNAKAPLDRGFDDKLSETISKQGFAPQGGYDLLSLVIEAANSAIETARSRKFNNHLRCRPEVLAARIAAFDYNTLPSPVSDFVEPMHKLFDEIGLLDLVKEHNRAQNHQKRKGRKLGRHERYLAAQARKIPGGISSVDNLPLLPMAFAEGCPMHPSNGAGHSTVAGACVTILKAFFDEDAVLVKDEKGNHTAHREAGVPFAYVPSVDGSKLNASSGKDKLTVGNELNKLAGNISMARNMGGVHFYSDYIDGMRAGEAIAIGILEEQVREHKPVDNFELRFNNFDGERCVIDGNGFKLCPTDET